MAMFRNMTGSLCPANPKWPFVRVSPGWADSPMKSVTLLTSASTMTVPLSSTLMVEPLTVTSW